MSPSDSSAAKKKSNTPAAQSQNSVAQTQKHSHGNSQGQSKAQPLMNDPMRNQVIMDYAPLIKFIAQRIAVRLPSNIDVEDLFSAGVIGLMDAIDKYDPSRDNKFKTYAEFRIRGAILDELRNQDWLPRSVRENNKREDKARLSLEQTLGRPPSEKEVADHLAISLEEFLGKVGRSRVSLVSIEDLGGSGASERKSLLESLESPNTKSPFYNLKAKGIKELIMKAVEELPEKQKLVLSLYYYEDLNLKEIGKILEVTESRVSQLHTQAVLRMKSKLKSHLADTLD
jgi:RNA polymerase sigma factor FliA